MLLLLVKNVDQQHNANVFGKPMDFEEHVQNKIRMVLLLITTYFTYFLLENCAKSSVAIFQT